MNIEKLFVEDASIPWDIVGEGVKRKIMSYDERVMMVKVAFEEAAIGSLHHHHHTQLSLVESGSFEVEIDGVKKQLSQGDVFYIPPNTVHGVVCLQAGVLIDVFSPMREDFV